MSRLIMHKIGLTDSQDSMSEATLNTVALDEANEVAHTREDEELSFLRSLFADIEELDEGEALVIRKVIF